ncbi:ATP synthase subunit I [Vallitalea guaymasensis]|uniref:ATP synthase subunit I n=1 Tax=Vallitalea guaymasensis TaxID=1185412 RepID=A0A8J8SCJ8_9FIRM|nr:ATP synthase subunit I [Vallitalea guaymasensis]QUH29516.1 ATP synthase subunit I [Vallitalea guaymasensis]
MNSEKSILIPLTIKITIIVVLSFAIGLFFVEDILAYGKGLALGGIFSILKLKLMEVTFKKALSKPPKDAQRYAHFHYFLRYLLTILVLVVGALEPTINLVGVIISIVSVKLAAYWQGYIEKPTPKDGSVEFLEWEDEEEESDF